ncbi:MAG: hypothetical protein PQJ49_00590, partial [Sphaerochaetaceae bacterium]|nr:hypothetical protein [Sphaerochaetaceae bacterium]
NKEITILENLISLKYEDVITPRLLINFINNLVVLWYRKSEIELKYLALYSLFEDEIKVNPSLMITQSGLDSFKINLNTFSDEEITKKLASLFYNISEDSAKKVLYDKTAKTELRNKTDNFEILIKDPTFFIWFEDVVVRNTLADFDFKNLVEIYQVIEKSYPSSPFIISFSQKILDSIKKEDIYSNELEWFIDSLKIEMQEKYFRKFYENLFEAEKINIDNYTLLLDKIFESSSKQSFNARFLSIKEQKINVSKFVELYFDRKEADKIDYFNYYNFVIDEEEVVKYFILNGIYKAHKLNQLQIIEYLINEFSKFSGDLFNQSNQDMLKNVINSNNSSNSKELIETVLRVNRWFSKGSINKLNNAQQIYTRYKAYGGDATTNADIIGIILSYLVGTNIVPSVPDIKEISTISKDNTLIILKYVNLQIILKLLVKYNIPVLKTLINNIIEFDIYEEIDSTMVFNNIKAIHKHLGSNIFKLLKYFDQFSEDFSGKKYAHLDDWEDLITEEYIATYKCIEFVYDYYINLFTKYENQDWEDVFSNKKEIYTIFKQLLRKNLIDLNIINNIKFYGAIREIINKYIDNELDIDVDLFYLIMGKLNKPSLNFIVPKIYNCANDSSYSKFSLEKRKFIFVCVLNNNSKIEKKSLLINEYFLPILNDDPEFINERIEDSTFVKNLSLFVRDYKKDYEVDPLIQSITNLEDPRYRPLLDILE